MNVFEGARRIAKAFTIIVIVAMAIIIMMQKPYLSRTYAFDADLNLIEVDTCGSGPSFYTFVKGVETVGATVCGLPKGPGDIDVPKAELQRLNDAISSERLKRRMELTYSTVAGLAVFWFLTWLSGWVVRGFMGIPHGQDYRTKQAGVK